MASGKYIIYIGTQGDVTGVEKVEGALKDLGAQARTLGDDLKLGLGIDIAGRLVDQVAHLSTALQEAVRRGVEFNATLEGTETAVAAVLERFQGISRQEALERAGDALDLLKQKAVAAPGTLRQLAESWLAAAGAASEANIPVEQQIDLMVRLSQAVSRLNLPQQQLVQETRALLTGNITLDAQLAKTLGVTGEMIRAAKEQGNLYEFLVSKIGALGEASDTLEVRWSNLQDTLDQLLGEATKPIFDEIRSGILALNEALADPAVAAALEELGFDIAGLVGHGLKLTEWAIRNADALLHVAEGAKLLAVAFAAVKVADLVRWMAGMTANLFRNQSALAAETAELAKNTAAQNANAAARAKNAGSAIAGAGRPARQQLGTPYSMDAYRAARAGGANATDALAQARRSMFLAQQESGRLAHNVWRLSEGMSALRRNIAAADERMGGFLKALASFAALDLAGRAGSAIGSVVGASQGYGTFTTKGSIDRAARMREHYGSEFDSLAERAKSITTEKERKDLLLAIDQTQDAFLSKAGKVSMWDGAERQMIEQLSREFGSLALIIREANLAEIGKTVASENYEKYREEVDAAQASAREILQKGTLEREQAAKAEMANRAASEGDVATLDRQLAEKRAEIAQARQQLTLATDEATAKTVAELINHLEEQLATLRTLRTEAVEAAGEKRLEEAKKAIEQGERNDEAATRAMRTQIELIEAMGDRRLAILESVEGSELQIALQRKQIEDEVAAKRLELEKRIATLAGATADDLAALDARHDAERLRRENEIAQIRRRSKQEEEKSAWDRSYRGVSGRSIDARSQRHYDTLGRLIMEKGEAVQQPSYLDAFRAESRQRRLAGLPGSGGSISHLLPPAERAEPAPAGDTREGARATAGGDTAKQVATMGRQLETAMRSIASTIESIARAASATDRGVNSAANSVLGALNGIQRHLARLESQVKNSNR